MDRQSTEELLLEYGLHLGYEGPRKELARDLEKGGLTGGDLRMVMDHVRDSGTSKSAGPRISSVLKDRDKWGPLLVDLRKFHEYRHRKDARMGKRKAEPGKGLRDQDQGKTETGTAEFFGLEEQEYQGFKWAWTVADWRNNGWKSDDVQTYMNATPEEQEKFLKQFPKGQTFDDALADYTGKGKTDASTPGSD